MVLPYGTLGKVNSQRYPGGLDVILAPHELHETLTLKQRRLNRKKIGTVAMVVLVVCILFGVYTAEVGSLSRTKWKLPWLILNQLPQYT